MNLPQPPTTFFGREREVANVAALMRASRVVTLTGPGGIGKTRLALEVAARCFERFGDNRWIVEFTPLTDQRLIARALAAALGLDSSANERDIDAVATYLHDRPALLIFDNCEHVAGACALLATQLLMSLPQLTILATSRSVLGLDNENVVVVPPLESDASLQLMLDRIGRIVPGFSAQGAEQTALEALCERLDYLPLALEITAPRLRLLAPSRLVARLANRFQLLTGELPGAEPRQRSLRALIGWSYDFLPAPAQAMFRRTAWFCGRFDLEGAAEIGAAGENTRELVEELARQSLLVREGREGEELYHFLGSTREFALEILYDKDDVAEVRRRHAEYCARAAERASAKSIGAQQRRSLETLDRLQDDLRAALHWSVFERNDPELGLQLCASLGDYWVMRGNLAEASFELESALAAAPLEPSRHRARALRELGIVMRQKGDLVAATTANEEALSLWRQLGDIAGVASAINGLALLAYERGEDQRASDLYEQAIHHYRSLEDRDGVARAMNNLAGLHFANERNGPAVEFYRQSAEIFRELGDERMVALVLSNLSEVLAHGGDAAAARESATESLALRRALGDRIGVINALYRLAFALYKCANVRDARTICVESLGLAVEIGYQRGIATALALCARIALEQNRAVAAVRVLAATDRIRKELGLRISVPDQRDFDGAISAARAAAGGVAFDEAWNAGSTLSLAHVIREASG